jgi:hypothetical protein
MTFTWRTMVYERGSASAKSRILCAAAMFGFTMIALAPTHGQGTLKADHRAFSSGVAGNT